MRSDRLLNSLRAVVAAARACGQRVLLGVPADVFVEDRASADVFATDGVPHAWLFPQMRFILHHGGAGTTGAAAASGVPSTAIPYSADQAFWARRIHRLGLGPAAPPAHRLTRAGLEIMMRDALADPAYQQRAAILGKGIRQEDGIASAIRVIRIEMGIGPGPESRDGPW
jgi:sterol 3beta-glucosyltransferase